MLFVYVLIIYVWNTFGDCNFDIERQKSVFYMADLFNQSVAILLNQN